MLNRAYSYFDRRADLAARHIESELGVPVDRTRLISHLFIQDLTDRLARRLPSSWVALLATRHFSNAGDLRRAVAGSDTGIILSVPHYGPFLWACIGAAPILRSRGKLTIFFQDPEANAGNRIINKTLSRFFDESEICFDDRRGLARSAKALRDGGVCILMPDATRSRDNSFLVPFLSGEFEVQPGVAALARLTGSKIVNTYVVKESGLTYRVETSPLEMPSAVASDPEVSDYQVMCAVMAKFAELVKEKPLGWRYWHSFDRRVLFRGDAGLDTLDGDTLFSQAEKLLRFV